MLTANNTSEKFLYYRAPEIILFAIYLLLGVWATIKQPEFKLTALLLGPFGYIFFIIEHKAQVIFDKVNGHFICKSKALFSSLEKIKHIESISDISNVYVTAECSSSKSSNSVNTYKIVIKLKNQKIIYPFGHNSTTDKAKYERMCKTIKQFIYQEQGPTLVIDESPFFLRLVFGIPDSIIYILLCLATISQ